MKILIQIKRMIHYLFNKTLEVRGDSKVQIHIYTNSFGLPCRGEEESRESKTELRAELLSKNSGGVVEELLHRVYK